MGRKKKPRTSEGEKDRGVDSVFNGLSGGGDKFDA